MVKNVILLLIGCCSIAMADAKDEQKSKYDGETLRQHMEEKERANKDFSERLKASRPKDNLLKLVGQEDIWVKLPNGEYVKGLLLPNRKKAPGVKTKEGFVPACVTTDYTLIPGRWDDEKRGIFCDIEQEKLALISDAVQVGNDQTEKRRSNKYQNIDSIENNSSEAERVAQTPSAKIDDDKSKRYGSSKYSKSKNTESNTPKNANYNPPKSGIVIPPRPSGGSSKSVGGSLEYDNSKFGISIGTWIKAELVRQANSADTGWIEFQLTETIHGKYRDLPAGTLLMANKRFNNGNRRLEAQTELAVLPNGEEIPSVKAFLFSLDETAGLSGSIVRDREGEIKSATSNALLNTASSLIPGKAGVVASAAGDVGDDLLSNERRYAPETPGAVITVSPQKVLFKVSSSF